VTVDAVLIAGPTAGGKSRAALALAGRICGAVVNTDSMQVYRDARILTGRPADTELSHVPHLLYGHIDASDGYSAARFQRDAAAALAQTRALGRVPIFTGGTGLYFEALTQGLAEIPAISEGVRKELRARRARLGESAFFAEFAARDPETAARLLPSDTQRVLRAFEVIEGSGRPLAHWQTMRGIAPLAEAKLSRFVLSPPRPELHRRIESRFEQMMDSGALEEAARLKGLDPRLPAAKILGLRELWAVLDGTSSLEAAKIAAKAATRQYAKRQLTWFRQRMADWRWIESEDPDEIVAEMLEQI